MAETMKAAAGQVWRDRDFRTVRYVLVDEVDHSFATVRRCGPDGLVHPGQRRSRIRLAADGTLSRYRLERDHEH